MKEYNKLTDKEKVILFDELISNGENLEKHDKVKWMKKNDPVKYHELLSHVKFFLKTVRIGATE